MAEEGEYVLIPVFIAGEVAAQLRSAGAMAQLKTEYQQTATGKIDIAVQTDTDAGTFLMSFDPTYPSDELINWISSKSRTVCLMCMVDGESALLGPYYADHTCEMPWPDQVQMYFDDACLALGVAFDKPEDKMNLYRTILEVGLPSENVFT